MKQGFKVMDSDIHVQEPHDLWDRYIESRFKDRAPRFTDIPDGSSPGVWRFEGKVFPAYIDRPERQRLAKIRRRKAHRRHEELGREVGPEAERRGEDPQSMLRAMDVEGIDVLDRVSHSRRSCTRHGWLGRRTYCRSLPRL